MRFVFALMAFKSLVSFARVMNLLTAGFLQNAITVVLNFKTSMAGSVRRQNTNRYLSRFFTLVSSHAIAVKVESLFHLYECRLLLRECSLMGLVVIILVFRLPLFPVFPEISYTSSATSLIFVREVEKCGTG